jgi:hypothetical protein
MQTTPSRFPSTEYYFEANEGEIKQAPHNKLHNSFLIKAPQPQPVIIWSSTQ